MANEEHGMDSDDEIDLEIDGDHVRVQNLVYGVEILNLLCVLAAENSDNVMTGMISCTE
jgi:hypothetical protein